MTDKEMEKLLTNLQTNLAIIEQNDDLRMYALGEALVKKAIGNLSEILDKMN